MGRENKKGNEREIVVKGGKIKEEKKNKKK